ncbi:MAG: endonuclease/exonuclease/phosphatase family protein [Gammaproteobacteria bacterium]|nr:endonuclease/exonuclease/phosphatase family protein [Gammaproteobacteria bacterium]
MRSLARPNPEHSYDPDIEINQLIQHRDAVPADPAKNRNIPAIGQAGQLMLASWNIANLGVHKRRSEDLRVIAQILSWFEIVAIQEIADNLDDFLSVLAELPTHFAWIFNDRAGNDERSAYIYDTRRVSLSPKIGEVVIVDSDRRYITLPGIERRFHGFNRNPYLAGFKIENSDLLLTNCHLIYGSQSTTADKKASMERRQLEAYAIARWCDLRRRDKHRWSANIIALGDFNLPHAKPGDPIHDALTKRGLSLPPHTTRIPTNVSASADYDQIAVTPGLKSKVLKMGVFDFDATLFADIYNASAPGYWRSCAKYYISDHRPLWMQLEL